jgi:hypothetical protein
MLYHREKYVRQACQIRMANEYGPITVNAAITRV